MGTKKPSSTVFLMALAIVSLTLFGCLGADAPSESGDVRVKSTHPDRRIAFLIDKMSVPVEAIKVETEGLAAGDTGYAIYPALSEEARKKGVLGSGFGFTAKSIDKMMKKAEALEKKKGKAVVKRGPKINTLPPQAADAARNASPLGKKAHTRWDQWYTLLDVKAITEVYQIRVYIYNATKFEVGPMWTQAVRNAMANWNNQAKGSAISFVETLDSNNADMRIRGVFGLGPNYTYTHAAYMTPDAYVEDGDLYLLVNIGFEHNGVPMNQKTACAMSLLAIGLNIGFTGEEGRFWNYGDLVHIPETPWYDGDAWTPGSSVLTFGSTSYSTPVLTEGDLTMARSVYPVDAVVATTQATTPLTLGYETLTTSGHYPSAKWMQVEKDTLYMTSFSGHVIRRIGTASYNVLWSGTYGGTGADEFIYSKGHMALRTFGGAIYTKVGNSGWVLQATGIAANSMRLDGNRLTYAVGSNRDLYDNYITATGSSWSGLVWLGSPGLTDFRTRNGLLAIAQDGAVWAMQNYDGWNYVHDPWRNNSNAERLYLSDDLVVMLALPWGGWYRTFSVLPYGIYGGMWYDYPYWIYSPNDIDVCDDKVAFLHESSYLSIIDFWEWMMYDHYNLPNPDFTRVRLTGENCRWVSAQDGNGGLYGKFSVGLDTDYFKYHNNTDILPSRW